MSLLDKTSPSAPNQEDRVWGEFRRHEHCSRPNIVNCLLCIFALVPSIVLTCALYSQCNSTAQDDWSSLWESLCTLGLDYPIWMANILFFVNVSIGFWAVGLIQRSFWLIDPYWTIIPPLLATFYQVNPKAETNTARSAVSSVLIWLWAARLTVSYFRREEWKFGQQEDWRYTQMARDWRGWWWLLSFFAVGLAQQPMLVGVTLPSYSIHRSDPDWNPWDTAAVVLAVIGLSTAYVADSQLHEYMTLHRKKLPVLNTGLWRYSRHPNYVGETLWWLAYGLFAVAVGQWYMLGGWVLNTAVLLQVTMMTENRMDNNRTGDRLRLWQEYKRTTPCWLPILCGQWFGDKTLLDQQVVEFSANVQPA